jgi:DNA-binding response OmpR family regulator
MNAEPTTDAPVILVVDDDADIRQVLDLGLSCEGYVVVTAFDGQDALDAVRAHPISLVLLDLNMPRLNGEGFAQAYRERGGTAPILLLTAVAPGAIDAAREACGAVEAIEKPFSFDDLLLAVARHVRIGARPR